MYNAVSEPVAATRNALAERQQGVREIAPLLYNRMVENMMGEIERHRRKRSRRRRQRATVR